MEKIFKTIKKMILSDLLNRRIVVETDFLDKIYLSEQLLADMILKNGGFNEIPKQMEDIEGAICSCLI